MLSSHLTSLVFAGMAIIVTEAQEGRVFTNVKPLLVFPATAPTRHQLISGIGIPLPNIDASLLFGWVMKCQYFLPSNSSELEPINVEDWSSSRRRRAIERYEVTDVESKVESLPDEADEDEDTDDEVFERDYIRSDAGYNAANSRWMVYKALEQLSDGYGFQGRKCVLRSICEAAESQFTHTGGVLAELLHILFSPSTTNEPISDHRDYEYHRAEERGRNGASCRKIYHGCSRSLLDMFTGVFDGRSDELWPTHIMR